MAFRELGEAQWTGFPPGDGMRRPAVFTSGNGTSGIGRVKNGHSFSHSLTAGRLGGRMTPWVWNVWQDR